MNIQFEYPQALWLALAPLLALASIFLFKRKTADSRLLFFSTPWQIVRAESRRAKLWFRLCFVAVLFSLVLFAIVLARPIRVSYLTQRIREGIDIVVVLDLSESMDADDLLPSRIVAAKKVIRDFIKRREGDRIGFVTFGGEAVTRSPLTTDHDFLLSQVDEVKLRELKQGTAIGMGLANGITRLRQSEAKNKIIVLLTDGDSNVGAINPITAAHLARQEGIRVYTIGIGKEDRVLVPIYAMDMEGRRGPLIAQVPSYLNPPLLREISSLTGGKAYMARDSGMLDNILREIDNLEKTKLQIHSSEKREQAFFPFALVATLLMAAVWMAQETRLRKARLAS